METLVKDRIDLRLSGEQKQMFKYAAELSGFKSLSEYIIFCVKRETSKVISDKEAILKTIEDKEIFINALLKPPAPNEKLKLAQITFKTFQDHGITDRNS